MYSVLSESTYKHAPDSSHACCCNLTGENEENGLTEQRQDLQFSFSSGNSNDSYLKVIIDETQSL